MISDIWRIIPSYEGTGAEQMAIDSWLLSQHARGLQPPCLRFYTWETPTLSLGYHQRQFPEAWNTLRWNNQPVDLVRRPTGGRAVLHQGDLTYALIASGLNGSRRAVYQQLCQFLVQGWQSLDVALSFGAAGRGYIHNPNCFGTATAADLVMDDGYKLIGSAQVYRDGGLLQHGSMRLRPDINLFETVFGEKIFAPDLPEAVLSETGMSLIVEALTRAAGACFEAEFEVRSLSSAEIAEAFTTFSIALEKPLEQA